MSQKVILIMTDTTRADMLGCYGNPDMYTPNLDKMAAASALTGPTPHSRCASLPAPPSSPAPTPIPAPAGPTVWDCPTMCRISDAV